MDLNGGKRYLNMSYLNKHHYHVEAFKKIIEYKEDNEHENWINWFRKNGIKLRTKFN